MSKKNVISFARGNVLYNAEAERAKNVIGTRITEARKKSGMSIVDFGRQLAEHGVSVGSSGLSKWEKGLTVPNAYQLLAISSILGVDDDPHYFWDAYIAPLNDAGMKKVADYKADLIASGNYRPETKSRSSIRYVEMPVSTLAVSAGTGELLGEDSFEKMRFPESSVPAGAEFGLRVNGDSMEPVYQNGQIVWIQQCSELSIGEVGIFIYDGEGYLKAYDEQEPAEELREDFTDAYGVTHPQPVLVSYNEKYSPRPVQPFAPFRIVGRVLR